MPASEAQILANRANAARSTGPRTPEGKAISRRNALKHGMAGLGVVILDDDSAEVRRRLGAMLVEMTPSSEMARYQVGRMAELTVQVEVCSRHRRAATAFKVAHAEADFDEARLAEVDHTLSWIAKEPATYARKLRSMPEGVDRLVAELLDLRDDLGTSRWDWNCAEKLTNLLGIRYYDAPVPRIRALSDAAGGDFKYLDPVDGEGLDDEARRHWALQELANRIDAETDSLVEHRKTLDFEAIEADRAGAADRALFDPSKEAILARRYEAAAERGVSRAVRELERLEALSAGMTEAAGPSGSIGIEEPPAPGPSGSIGIEGPPAPEPLASIGIDAPPAPRPSAPNPQTAQAPVHRITGGASDGPMSVGWNGPGRA